jgi:hypothetical protein
MALRKQVIPVQIQTGLVTGKDPKTVQQGLLRLENALWPRTGEVAKRHGFTSLTGTLSEQHLASYKERPYLVDDESIKQFDGSVYNSGGFDTITTDIAVGDATIERLTSRDQCKYGCVAESLSVRAVAYEEDDPSGNTKFTIKSYDKTTGRLLATHEVAGSATSVDCGIRVVWTGAKLRYFYVDNVSDIIAGEINQNTGAIDSGSAMSAASGDVDTSIPIDVCGLGGDYLATMIVVGLSASNDAMVVMMQADDSEATNTITLTDCQAVGCYKLADDVGISMVYDDGAAPHALSARGHAANTANVTISAADLWTDAAKSIKICTGAAASDTTSWAWFTVFDSGATYNAYETHRNSFNNVSGTGTAGASSLLVMGVALGARALWHPSASSDFLLVYNPQLGIDQNAYYIIRGDSGWLCGKLLEGWGRGNQVRSSLFHQASVHGADSTTWKLAVPHRSAEDTYGLSLIEFTNDPDHLSYLETEHHMLLPGAIPQYFDGDQVIEMGYSWYPWAIASSLAGTGITGTYGYKVIYERVDAQGNLHRSAPSPNHTATPANDTVTITIPTLGVTGSSDVRCVVYRTLNNGNLYYRVGAVANDESAATVTFADDNADASISSNETLYTDGGVLENTSPYQHAISTLHQDRVCYSPHLFPTRVYYSQQFLPGTGPEFPNSLYIQVNPEGGDITALESFIDRLIIFKNSRIYASHGVGKSALGAGRGYTDPLLISEAVGCINRKSIVRLPQGLAFLAEDGFWLLDKSLNVKPIGDDVRYQASVFGTLQGSAIIPDKHVAVWFSSTADAIAFDWVHGVWSTWTNSTADAVVASYDGELYFKDTSTTVKVWNRAVYQDDASNVSLLVDTGWFSFAGLTGLKRIYGIRLLGQNLSSHTLRVKAAFDHDIVWVDNQTFTSSGLQYVTTEDHYGAGLASSYINQAYMLEVKTSRQKVTSMRLQISDESGTGASFSLASLGFSVGLKQGLTRGQTARTVS